MSHSTGDDPLDAMYHWGQYKTHFMYILGCNKSESSYAITFNNEIVLYQRYCDMSYFNSLL